MGGSELAASSTLSEKKRTTECKLVKEMALLCSIHDLDFRSMVEKHNFGLREDLSEKVEFYLAYSPYNVRRDQYNDHAEYDVLDSDDMKDIAKVL